MFDNNNFAALQFGQENDPVFAFSLWYLAPRSLALEVFKSPILSLLQSLQGSNQITAGSHLPVVPKKLFSFQSALAQNI